MASRSCEAAVLGGKRYDFEDGAPVFDVRRDASIEAMFWSCEAKADMVGMKVLPADECKEERGGESW